MFDAADPRNWFTQKRFGFMVHWGLYAVHAVHEQEIWRYRTPVAEYNECMKLFNPVKFNPAQWLDMLQENGMEYLVFTAKHHDGFCMWDTAETTFNVMHTPYHRDVAGMLAEECHKRNVPLEFYYSCVDWHHPAYPNLGRHHEIVTDPSRHDFPAYLEFVKHQITELCTNYGTIHGIWWDMNVPEHQAPEIHDLIHRLQPAAVINNRGYAAGDYSTPERNFQETGLLPFANLTEACESLGMNSWGYRRDEDYYSCRKLERSIALYTACGGNFLLNAGPMADGEFPEISRSLLQRIGRWYRRVGSALRQTPCCGLLDLPGVLCTGGGKELNLVLLDPPAGETLRLPGLETLPEEAVLLNTGERLAATSEPTAYTVFAKPAVRLRKLPADRMNEEIPVIKLTFRDAVIQGKKVAGTAETSGSQAGL